MPRIRSCSVGKLDQLQLSPDRNKRGPSPGTGRLDGMGSRRGSTNNLVSMWNQVSDDHIKSQSENAFSDHAKSENFGKLDKNDPDYGKYVISFFMTY